MTNDEIFEAFQTVLGMNPRSADLATLSALGRTPEAVAEYLWDHMLGEPGEPTLEQVEGVVDRISGIVTIKLTKAQAEIAWSALDGVRENLREELAEGEYGDPGSTENVEAHAHMESIIESLNVINSALGEKR